MNHASRPSDFSLAHALLLHEPNIPFQRSEQMAENEMHNKDKIEDVNKPQSQDIDKDIDQKIGQGNVEKFPGKQQDIKQQDANKDQGLKKDEDLEKDEDIQEKEAV
jgi:hypothetical protein